MTWQTGY